MERDEMINQMASEVFDAARTELLVNMRFLSGALNKLGIQPAKVGFLATDGKSIGFSAIDVLKKYKDSPEIFTRNYLHVVLHCLFRHTYIGDRINKLRWTVSCDIATEALIESFGLGCLGSLPPMQKEIIVNLKKELKFITAEKLSNYFEETNTSIIELERLYKLFVVDSHKNWFKNPDKNNDSDDNDKQHQNGDLSGSGLNDMQPPDEEDLQSWKKISKSIQTDLEMFTKYQGFSSQDIIQAIRQLNREKYDYSEFLRKFAVFGEVTEINDEEFDYIYYNYGFQLYGRIPLIEPLEYKDVKRVKDFVIAIDTSRSVKGELVRTFMEKTYNILKSTENFFRKVNIRIIQCDTKIKENFIISSLDELDNYIGNMNVTGFGGTDFRPVFQYVNWLVESGELSDLGGLIYFTDGYGEYPEAVPEYNTAFVFVENSVPDEQVVPSWAIKIILSKYELMEN